MVSCRAFWVAISYGLTACFTRIGIEIYWQSFQHFRNYNYSIWIIARKKMTKMRQKLLKKIERKLRWFLNMFVMRLF